MLRFDRETLQPLLGHQEFPCISIYLPIIREGNEVVQPQVRLRTLLRQAEDHLRTFDLTVPRIRDIQQPAWDLLDEPFFWATAREGVAIFLSDGPSMVFTLDQAPEEKMVIDDHFVVRPLLETDTPDAEYLLLAISRSSARIYRGSRTKLIPIPVSDFPESLDSIISVYDFEKQRRQYGGRPTGGHGAAPGVVNHGLENRKDRDRLMVEAYCREIDARILERWSKEDLPLVLACVEYLFGIYQKISKNPRLLDEYIPGSPDHLSEIELRDRAFAIVQRHLPDQRSEDWALAQSFFGSERIRENIRQIIEAADHGRVDKLFIPRGRILPGWFDEIRREIRRPAPDETIHPFTHCDLLEEAAVRALNSGAQIYAIDPDQIPAGADAVALLRY